MENIWTPLYLTIDGNKLIAPKNHPENSGDYVCTCVKQMLNGDFDRFLKVKHYDAKSDRWHDVGNPSGLSHVLLAYTDKIKPCDIEFDYFVGGVVLEKGTLESIYDRKNFKEDDVVHF